VNPRQERLILAREAAKLAIRTPDVDMQFRIAATMSETIVSLAFPIDVFELTISTDVSTVECRSLAETALLSETAGRLVGTNDDREVSAFILAPDLRALVTVFIHAKRAPDATVIRLRGVASEGMIKSSKSQFGQKAANRVATRLNDLLRNR
jgi:hypothetical protein